MFKFHGISQIEHGEYPFEDAVVDTEVLNGAIGTVENGKFTVSESGTKVVMQLEVGDDECVTEYKIPAGSHVRVLDPAKVDGELEVYGYPLPDTFTIGTKVGSFKVTEIIGNKVGAVVTLSGAEAAVSNAETPSEESGTV